MISGETIERELRPFVRSLITKRLGAIRSASSKSTLEEEVDDLVQNTLLSLTVRLSTGDPIENLRSYAAVTANNACDEYFRKTFRVRASLAAKVRYVLERQPGLAIWPSEAGHLVAGYAAWSNQAPRNSGRLRELIENPVQVQHGIFGGDTHGKRTADLVDEVLRWAGSPVPFDSLVSVIAEATGTKDSLRAHDPEGQSAGSLIEYVPANEPTSQTLLEIRESLVQIWDEVKLLPTRQAQALLLNFRDSQGRGILDLLLITKASSVSEIAQILGIELSMMVQIWNELPWDDAHIARFMNCTTVDVTNLRSVGRRRLARRLAQCL